MACIDYELNGREIKITILYHSIIVSGSSKSQARLVFYNLGMTTRDHSQYSNLMVGSTKVELKLIVSMLAGLKYLTCSIALTKLISPSWQLGSTPNLMLLLLLYKVGGFLAKPLDPNGPPSTDNFAAPTVSSNFTLYKARVSLQYAVSTCIHVECRYLFELLY